MEKAAAILGIFCSLYLFFNDKYTGFSKEQYSIRQIILHKKLLKERIPVTIPYRYFILSNKYIIVVKRGYIIGVHDIRLVRSQKNIFRKHLMDRLQIHLRHNPLFGSLYHDIILQSLDEKDIFQLYPEITPFRFHKDMTGGNISFSNAFENI